MKKLLFLIAILSCLASYPQTPIKSLYNDDTNIPGAYYKDTFNDLDNYIGTWKYTNGTTTLTIILQKKVMQYFSNSKISYYEDIIVGEYEYIENGVEKINTLGNLTLNLSTNYLYNIVGNVIVGPQSYYCLNCGPNDRKLLLQFNDPNRNILGMEAQMIFQRNDLRSLQRLSLNFRNIGTLASNNGNAPQYTTYTVPFGKYTLVKQP